MLANVSSSVSPRKGETPDNLQQAMLEVHFVIPIDHINIETENKKIYGEHI